jgi:uncharacterized protein (DUF1778 family)
MSRLSIDVTEQQHQTLKAMAALEGKSIKQFALEQLFGDKADEASALDELRQLLSTRVAEAQRGECLTESITEVATRGLAQDSA